MQDLIRGIKKLTETDRPAAKETVVVQETAANTAPLLKRAFIFLEDGDWSSADEYCEKVLDLDPENAQAYLGKLMAELRVRKVDDLANCEQPFDGKDNYRKVMRFGGETLRDTLEGYIAHINDRNENARLTGIYNDAANEMNRADSEDSYRSAADSFRSISGFKDADALAERCLDKAEICRKDAVYASAKEKMTDENTVSYEDAIYIFKTISGWKDADEQIVLCQQKIEALRLADERKAEEERIAAEIAAKKRKKALTIAIPIMCACIAFVIVLTTVITPKQKYNVLVAKYGQEYVDAFYALDVGDTFELGSYEQDNISNGKEKIEWIVLVKENGKALVISKYALDCQPYNTSCIDVTWKNCTLRRWLNNDFINSAFSADEKSMILVTTVSADKNPQYSTNPGAATRDQVFLLSVTEVDKYFSSAGVGQCGPTDYAVANGAWKGDKGGYWVWLRSPGIDPDFAASVSYDAYNSSDVLPFCIGKPVGTDSGSVRPAMWIELG